MNLLFSGAGSRIYFAKWEIFSDLPLFNLLSGFLGL